MFMLIISTRHKVQYILWTLYSLLAAISTHYLHGKRRILAKLLSQLGSWRPEWHLCCCCSRNAFEDLHNLITATRQLLAGRGEGRKWTLFLTVACGSSVCNLYEIKANTNNGQWHDRSSGRGGLCPLSPTVRTVSDSFRITHWRNNVCFNIIMSWVCSKNKSRKNYILDSIISFLGFL